MGNSALSKLSCKELWCPEYVTDIGEQWVREKEPENRQITPWLEQLIEKIIAVCAVIQIFIATGIFMFGLYTYYLRKEITSDNHRLDEDGFINLLTQVPIILMTVGAIVFVTAFFGFAGILRHHFPSLIIYLIFLILYTLLQLICAIVAISQRDKIPGYLTDYFSTKAIARYRDDPDLQNLIDFFQVEYSCCGGGDRLDWSNNIYFNCTSNNPSFERCSVPFSCCVNATLSQITLPNRYCGYESQIKSPEDLTDIIYTKGCVTAVFDKFSDYAGRIVITLACLILVPLVLEALLICMIIDVDEELDGYIEWRNALDRGNTHDAQRAREIREAVANDPGLL